MSTATPGLGGRADARIDTLLSRLLDLSLRNRLLNFKSTKQSMCIATGDVAGISAVEDAFSRPGAPWLRMAATAFPDDIAAQWQSTTADLSRGILRMRATDARCATDSIEIFRRAQRTLDETGANPLFLVIGTLEHRDPESGQSARAPLILVPLEIARISSTEGCRVRRSEQDITLNAALDEFLRQRHRLELGLLELPEDDAGIDVRKILDGVRTRIATLPGWQVHEEAHVACLDFRKWPLWTDVRDRRAQITAHPVVGTVLERRATPAPLDSVVLEAQDPVQLALPLPCDGSQLAAVLAAGSRRSFVLQGPPGTGKSQTITNLVSHAVAGGLRVLFVAEKQVALDVVARRLEEAGLGPWMLNLHPERCGRAEFVAQVKDALDRLDNSPRSANVPAPSGECTKLASLRDVTATVRASGQSAYGAVARLEELAAGPLPGAAFDLSRTVNALVTKAQVDAMIAAAQTAADAGARAARGSLLSSHPLHDLGGVAPAAALLAVARAVRKARETGTPMTTIASAFEATAGWEAKSRDFRAAAECIARAERADAAFRADGRFEESVLGVDPLPLVTDLRTRGARFWPFGWWARRGIARTLAAHAPQPVATDRVSLEAALALIGEVRAARGAAQPLVPALVAALGTGNTASVGAMATLEALAAVSASSTAVEQAAGAANPGAAGGKEKDMATAIAAGAEALESLAAAGNGDRARKRAEQARRWAGAADTLAEWFAWRVAEHAAIEAGVGPIADGVRAGTVVSANAPAITERAVLQAWLRSLHNNVEQFRSFDPVLVERMSDAYARAFDASRRTVAQRAAASVKQRFAAADQVGGEEMARLAELRGLQRPRRSIRTLIRQTGGALAAVKPIVLASPLSAAMHLDPALPPFDLVVFDEASQVPLADALGALSRATSAVVVGDSKQLPPTSFFDSGAGGDDPEAGTTAGSAPEDDQGFEELESLLDECVASRFPELMLRWHYRSRDERLIAFSNAHIYGGRLQTFPSAFRSHPLLGVSLRVVQGTYDRSKTRTNRTEAEAVVAELASRLRSPDASPANRSLGVVAFSIAQQNLVQDLFDALIDGDESVRATVLQLPEPILIKNLEAVQGDERATMMFSIGYGRDTEGKLAMNFGPMNRAGGERRLNVAITRAREQMIVFSTIRAGDLDLGKSGAAGIRLLRDFLEFAECGQTAAAKADPLDAASQHAGNPDALEESIARALEQRGWTVDRHVGRSNYRISLALRDKAHPDRWCLGVELDGPFWHSGTTVADREILRPAVLRSLGWRTMRVWSTEWVQDPAKVVERIEAAAAGG
jgi:hypothetical protein